jgi:hypothetical protein
MLIAASCPSNNEAAETNRRGRRAVETACAPARTPAGPERAAGLSGGASERGVAGWAPEGVLAGCAAAWPSAAVPRVLLLAFMAVLRACSAGLSYWLVGFATHQYD